jgi:hypothetical protein
VLHSTLTSLAHAGRETEAVNVLSVISKKFPGHDREDQGCANAGAGNTSQFSARYQKNLSRIAEKVHNQSF